MIMATIPNTIPTKPNKVASTMNKYFVTRMPELIIVIGITKFVIATAETRIIMMLLTNPASVARFPE